MRVTTLIPLLALVAMAIVLALASRDAPPLAADFGRPPQEHELPTPELDLGEAELVGTVYGADGKPVEGASLFVVQRGRPLWTFTDRHGAFVLGGLREGPVEVSVHAPEQMATTIATRVGVGPVSLRLTEPIPQDFHLPDPEPSDLTGWIVADGRDLGGFEVALTPTRPADLPGSGIPRRTICDGEGHFQFDALTPGDYQVILLPPWARGGSWPDLLGGLNGPPIRFSHPLSGPLQIPLGSGSVAGTAFDQAHGEVLSGALVVALPLTGSGEALASGRFPPVRTDAGGAYRLDPLPAGRYRVILTAGEEVREREVEVRPRETTDPGF